MFIYIFFSAKKKRYSTVERNERDRSKHPMLQSCEGKSCRKKCHEKITEDQRRDIWQRFWQMDYNRRRTWLATNIVEKDKKYQTTHGKSRRSNTRIWTLGSNVVCKTFFLNTLGFTNSTCVDVALKNAVKTDNTVFNTTPDRRGRCEPSNKLPEGYQESVISHIESYRPQVSHYRREHAPNRRYLPTNLSVAQMHTDFIQNKSLKCSYQYYHQIFHTLNITFSPPSNDKCKRCDDHERAHPKPTTASTHESANEEHKCEECECDLCEGYIDHRKNKQQAREALEKDTTLMEEATDGSIIVTSVDMQKGISMPKLPVKEYYFSRKLVLFNETFASPGKNTTTTCFLWHEASAGRKAFNITSTYLHFCKKYRDASKIIFYGDNCSSQNKCWILFSAMTRIINDPSTATEVILFKYFEPGHSFMPADSVHGNIQTKLSKCSYLGDMADYIKQIEGSRKNMSCIQLDHTSMKLFSHDCKKVPVLLKTMKIVEFRRGSLKMYYKTSFDEAAEYRELDFLKRATVRDIEATMSRNENPLDSVPTMEAERGIPEIKKQDMLKLSTSLPAHKRIFFEQLPANNAAADLEVMEDY